MLEKLGFQREGVHRECSQEDDGLYDGSAIDGLLCYEYGYEMKREPATMTGTNEQIQQFWQTFVRSAACPPGVKEDQAPPAGSFGDNPELANRLGRLVYDGVKTATCSALWEWEYDGDPLP